MLRAWVCGHRADRKEVAAFCIIYNPYNITNAIKEKTKRAEPRREIRVRLFIFPFQIQNNTRPFIEPNFQFCLTFSGLNTRSNCI